MQNQSLQTEAVAAQQFEQQHGVLVTGPALWGALGYSSGAAFRKARSRRQLAIKTFKLPNRRGYFAFTHQVAIWLKGLELEA